MSRNVLLKNIMNYEIYHLYHQENFRLSTHNTNCTDFFNAALTHKIHIKNYDVLFYLLAAWKRFHPKVPKEWKLSHNQTIGK